MTYFTVWIDRMNAKVFHLSDENAEKKVLRSHFHDHHTHQLDQLDMAQREKKLFQAVTEELAPNTPILIMGPGVVKHHFQNYLNEHHPVLSKKVVACETVDHLTDSQIVAESMARFNNLIQ